tara:strand:- start:695 stop:1372 length:678 start_codon:yes stop_codon:yes gene_type:complete
MAIFFEDTRGASSRRAKLTEEQVISIRQEYDDGLRGKDHAAKYNISGENYNRIGKRKTWASLEERRSVIFAIDAGQFESGFVRTDCKQIYFKGIIPNDQICLRLRNLNDKDDVAIEMIASYGMPVGKSVFETCLAIGRMIEAYESTHEKRVELIYRKEVKQAICGSVRANDATIRQALIDFFPQTGGGKTPAIGIKSNQGALYGMKSHCWSALAVAFTFDKKFNG